MLSLLMVLGLSSTLGCASKAELSPAPAAHQVPGVRDAAVAEVSGVEMQVESDAWPGPTDIDEEVTPLRVRIENGSSHPLRIRYSEFALISYSGHRHAAVPPYAVTGSVEEPVIADPHDPITPTIAHSRFRVASHYRPIYPHLTVFPDPFYYDPFYHRHYSAYWRNIPLPTPAMLERVLPEGVVDPGGMLEGHLYFEPVSTEEVRVRFRADLVDAASGEEFGEISVPFDVHSSAAE